MRLNIFIATMSRFTEISDEGKDIAYGFDHALGYWFDVYEEDEHGEVIHHVEESTALTGMNNGKMLKLMEAYNIRNEAHFELVAADMPI